MGIRRRDVLKLLTSSAAGAITAGLGSKTASASKTGAIERDICVIGGGAAGTYAALRLRDLGRSVVVLERTRRLGGHCETFHDPVSGTPIDIGVVIFPDNTLVRNLFGRFNVPLVTFPSVANPTRFADFRTGQPVNAFDPPATDVGAALFAYLNLLITEFAFLEQNGYQLPGPGPVLDELLLPFGQFARAHGLDALLPTFFLFEQGYGPLLDATSLYVLKNMSSAVVGSILGGSFLTTPSGAGALYDAATVALADDVVFGAEIERVDRDDPTEIRVGVETDAGARTVRCRKLVVTAPPVLDNLRAFDLDRTESATFGRFRPNHYWTAVVSISGLPQGLSLVNRAPETPANLAPLPGIYSLNPTRAPGLFNVKFGSDGPLSDAHVRAAIARDIQRLQVPAVGPVAFKGFATFKNHSPYALMAPPEAIRQGFYGALQSLQGRRGTFHASAAFQTHNSAAVWALVEGLLPSIAS